jgi:hypothetical protein
MAKIKVACHMENGVMLNLFKKGYDDGTGDGVAPTIRDGAGVRLNGPAGKSGGTNGGESPPGVTEVDGEWFTKWLKQNELNPMVGMNLIYAMQEVENPTK